MVIIRGFCCNAWELEDHSWIKVITWGLPLIVAKPQAMSCSSSMPAVNYRQLASDGLLQLSSPDSPTRLSNISSFPQSFCCHLRVGYQTTSGAETSAKSCEAQCRCQVSGCLSKTLRAVGGMRVSKNSDITHSRILDRDPTKPWASSGHGLEEFEPRHGVFVAERVHHIF